MTLLCLKCDFDRAPRPVAQALLIFIASVEAQGDIVKVMFGKIIGITTALAGVLFIIVIQTTKPSTIGPVGLLAVFFLLYVWLLGLITLMLWLSARGIAKISRPFTTKKPLEALSLQRSYYFSSVIALGPVMMVAMQSIGSLKLYEVGLIVIFLLVGILYVAKRSH